MINGNDDIHKESNNNNTLAENRIRLFELYFLSDWRLPRTRSNKRGAYRAHAIFLVAITLITWELWSITPSLLYSQTCYKMKLVDFISAYHHGH